MISSHSNPKIKYVRRLQSEARFRARERRFVVEGTRWMTALTEAEQKTVWLFATEAWQASHQALVAQWPLPPLLVSPAMMRHMSETETPAGVLAVVAWPTVAWPIEPSLILVLDALRDPGNMGTLLRTAVAAGVAGLLLAPECVDLFNPKVVRSSMGALLHLPTRRATWEEIRAETAHTTVYLATGAGPTAYTAVRWSWPSTLIIGGEAHGASDPAQALASQQIAIPMHGGIESLNAAVAASIILFEAQRQRLSPKTPL